MSNYNMHPYHLVDESPWPLVAAAGGMTITTGTLMFFHKAFLLLLSLSGLVVLLCMYQWWRDVTREASLMGFHSSLVELGMRWGMALFIISEVMLFFSFFWAFFHSSLCPAIEGGSSWPPTGVVIISPYQVPLLNTVVLLSSGASCTWAHHAMMEGRLKEAVFGLQITIVLGAYFTALQMMEYFEATFTMADSVYGSTFFIATGFHGLHVLVGTSFLLVCAARMTSLHFSPLHHFGFEAAAWYWHFVDVVWLFLFITIYWWGGL